ncbi:MAG: hypothetical protein IPK93_04660 [Solirubrobacterales bacterium]|nr:hypothetical protein [Solirubrobacterales bacterium]
MGILDEAIREHLELKRSHGADESELDGLQAEAFGPADRPDAVEAQTEVISPGSDLTTPAGEGDQLDKVFEATRVAEESGETEPPSGDATDASEAKDAAEATESPKASENPEATDEDATVAEHRVIPSPSAETTATELPKDDAIHEADTAEAGPPEPAPGAPAAEKNFDEVEGGDAGDALQRERMTLSGHPTEHYDVDAAIAEENEIDILSESSLSDELDRALDGPDEAAAPAEPEAEPEAPEPEPEVEFEPEATGSEEVTEPVEEDADFFDQDDPLEATPDFLEETPEHDRLWFEQKPPKDFEFGD